jgi:hypothetical protein
MKKIILSVLFSITSLFAIAEERGWYLSGIVSFGLTDISTTALSENLTMGYMLSPHFGVFGGLGAQTNKHSGFLSNQRIATANYFQVPAFIRFITSKAGRVGFYSDLGIKVNFKVSETLYDYAYGNSYFYDTDALVFIKPGIKIPFSKVVSINLGPEFSFGTMESGVFFSGSLNVFLGKTLKPKSDPGTLQDW